LEVRLENEFSFKVFEVKPGSKICQNQVKKGFYEALKMLNYEREHCQNQKMGLILECSACSKEQVSEF
jgi:hypothetical protein